MTRETNRERTARIDAEMKAAKAQFEQEKPLRLLKALALAHDNAIDATMAYNKNGEMTVAFNFEHNTYYGAYNDLESWELSCIEEDIATVRREREEQERMYKLRQDVLSRLTPDERRAMGF